jgi:hypothetical protein
MDRCPLCRATLNGADTCRRCRAELRTVQRVEREGQALLDAAMYHLSRGDTMTAGRLVRRARALHAAPEAQALWWLVTKSPHQSAAGGNADPQTV